MILILKVTKSFIPTTFLQSSTAKTNGHENGTSSKSKHRDRNGENGVDENGDDKKHHRKHKKKSRHLERIVSFSFLLLKHIFPKYYFTFKILRYIW